MNAAHIHLVVNHLPVMGLLFGAGFLVVGLLSKKDLLIKSAFVLFIIAAIGAVITFFSGEGAEEVIEHLPGVDGALIHTHEEAGETALIGMIGMGLLAIGGLWVYRFMNRIRITAAVLIFLASVLALGWLAYTANLGGDIRHPEVRKDFVPPDAKTPTVEDGD